MDVINRKDSLKIKRNEISANTKSKLKKIAKKLEQNDPSLTKLDLRVSEEEGTPILYPKNICTVISAECMGDQGIKSICDAISKNHTVRSLCLSCTCSFIHTQILGNNISDEGVQH